ncbi:MAG: serine dehydratase subunit alpha family protein [Bacteroidales bacterium]|nr:serine dehydratase subunit alpha family protein [Bacteroidales bacterium]
MLSRYEIQKILKLLRKEVVPAIGCNEPRMVAFACAKAREVLGREPEMVKAKLSGHIIKYAMGVGIPGSGGMVGIPAAIALGTLAGKTELGLELLNDITPEDCERAKQFVADRRWSVIQARNTFEIVYAEVKAVAEGHQAKVIIAKDYCNIVYIKNDNEVLVDERSSLATEHDRNHESELSMAKIFEFSTKCPLDELQFLLSGAHLNKKVAEMAFCPEADYGLNLGKMLKGEFEERMVGQNAMPRVVSYTCAATDVRMSGVPVPLSTNSGSGNQGIAVSLPILVFAEETQCTESKTMRALAIGNLVNIYIRQLLGKLSAHCSCVLAATGAACGITYLMGGSYEQITYAVKNQLAGATGMICDGCKPSCVLKLSSAVSSAFQSAMMAMENIHVASTDGIIEDDVDKCIDNLASIGRDAMLEVDNVVLNIMTDKHFF